MKEKKELRIEGNAAEGETPRREQEYPLSETQQELRT